MKKWIVLICLLFAVNLCAGMLIVGQGGLGTSGGAPSYLAEETFDAAGYDIGACGVAPCWDEGGAGTGAPDEDYATAPAPLEGTQSLRVNPSAGKIWARITLSAAHDNFYIFGMFNAETFEGTTDTAAVSIESVGNELASMQKSSGSEFTLLCGSSESTETASYNAATDYYYWLEYEKGTGANAKCRLYINTTPTKPSVTKEITNGDAVDQADRVFFGGYEADMEMIYDDVKIDDVAIGSAP